MTDLARPDVRSPKRAEAWARKAFRRAAAGGGVVPSATWLVPDRFVNHATGSDSNTGTSLASPFKTVERVVQAWGTVEPRLPQSTAIHVGASEPLGAESIVLRPVMVGGVNFGILGTPILVAGPFPIVGPVTAKNRPAGVLLQANGFPTALTVPGMLVVNQSKGNSRARIYRQVAGGHVTLTQPLTPLTFADASSFPSGISTEDDTWAPGDMVSVYALPSLNLKELRVEGGDSTPTFSGGASWVQYISIPDASGAAGNSIFEIDSSDNVPWFVDCSFEPYVASTPDTFSGVDQKFIIGCALDGGLALQAGTMAGGYVSGFGASLYPYANIDMDAIVTQNLNGPGVGALNTGSGITILSAAFLDSPFLGTTAEAFNGGTVKIDMVFLAGGPFVWGPAGLNVSDNSHVQKVAVATWSACLLLTGGLGLNGVATGSSFNPGAAGNPYTPGVALTPANLDANQSLSNPDTQASYFHE
jgi:hypothetical protein